MYDFLNGSEKIKASEQLKKKVRKEIMKHRIRTTVKMSGVCAAAVVLAFSISVNASQEFAFAMSDIPVLSAVVKVVTFGRYSKTIGGSEANIVIPKLEGLADKELEKTINAELAKDAEELIKEFEIDATKLNEYTNGEGHMGIDSNYIVKTDTDKYYAIDVYVVNMVGSSSTTHKFYTVDRTTKNIVTLKGLFKGGSDYVGRISEYILSEMKRMNKEDGGMFWIDEDDLSFKQINENQNFYINENNELVICFDKYEVAAGAQGSPEFVIPTSVISDILVNGTL